MASLATQIRLNKVAQRQNKPKYKGISEKEKKIVKLRKEFELVDKDLNDFWRKAPRKNGAVNWDDLSENELDVFDYIFKKHEKLIKSLSKYSEDEISKALSIFKQINMNGTSF